jgi:hypothetical protein
MKSSFDRLTVLCRGEIQPLYFAAGAKKERKIPDRKKMMGYKFGAEALRQ